jgi:hypothetical protein
MSFSTAYLTVREINVWDLRRKNKTQAEIGRLLGFTRQASNRALGVIDTKIERAFREAAVSNNLEVRNINSVDGVMEAYSPIHKMPVFVSLSSVNGLKVWYMHEGDCGSCSEERNCRKYLEAEAAERGIEISREDWRMPPTQLAIKIFSRYLGANRNA